MKHMCSLTDILKAAVDCTLLNFNFPFVTFLFERLSTSLHYQ